MKLQNLSIIFVIIIMPVILILSAYIGAQIDTASLQQSYNTTLLDATHDAVVAFELNTRNDNYSNNSESTRRDIKAAINIFSSSLATGLKIPGANPEYIMPYIPAILITLYDGYYIYSPSEYSYSTAEGQKTGYTHVLKPYVYYSEKYESGSNYVVVNYSLDNYITIYGVINGNVISNAGYLENNEILNNIQSGESLSETIIYKTSSGYQKTTARFVYYNGRKVYKIGSSWYYLNDVELLKYNGNPLSELDYSANEYKNSAKKFNDWIKSNTSLLNLVRPENAVNKQYTTSGRILDINNNTNNPEDAKSLFNQHKREVIKLSIQDNLNNAIAIYNANSGAMGTNEAFSMPKLNEQDWEKILTNVNMVTFMQGLSVGNKIYNNYAVVTSTNNKQYISSNCIYLVTNDNTYHTVEHLSHISPNEIATGYKSADFKKVNYHKDETTGAYKYYYRRPEYGCYDCIVDSYEVSTDQEDNSINSIPDGAIKRSYITALARERYNLDKVTKALINYN